MKGVFIILTILFIPMASAITFPTDTSFAENNIKYVFKQGITFEDFDISDGGITINDDEKLGLAIQGGELTVTFYEYSQDVKTIGLKSSVPQTINFQVVVDGKEYYLNDGESYYLNSYNIDTEEVMFNYTTFGDTSSASRDVRTADKLDWWEQKFVEFEIYSEIDDNGIIRNKTLTITYMFITISTFLLLIGGIIWMVIRK